MTAPVPSMTQACTIRFAKSKATILDSVMVDLPSCSGTVRCRVGHDRVPFVQDREGPSHHPEVRGRSPSLEGEDAGSLEDKGPSLEGETRGRSRIRARASKERTAGAQDEGAP